MSRIITISRLALATAAGMACLFVTDNTSSIPQSGLISQADARVGRPGTPMSVAGVARRQTRHAVGAGAVIGGAAIGAGGYYGRGGYYGASATDGYAAAPSEAPAGTVDTSNGYVPDPTSVTVMDPSTGRRCTIQANGFRWCWTP
jgi:hypothetical protein